MKFRYLPFLALSIFSCTENNGHKEGKDADHAVAPKISKDRFSYSFSNVYFEADSTVGGRISSFQLNGKELLYTNRANDNNNWGSTFWPSPQQLWGWPPPASLDSEPYRNISKNDTIVLQSGTAQLPKVYLTKSFFPSLEDSSVTIVYSLHNAGDTAVKLSPWEITRVPSGGQVLFPKGNDSARGELQPLTRELAGTIWLDYDSASIPKGVPKLFADGAEGWIAYVNNSRQVLIKKFDDSSLNQKAPDPEDEIEIYTHPDNHYIEVEQQGPYSSIAPGKSSSWIVKWFAREIPQGMDVQPGSPELLKFIRGVVGKK